MRRTVKAVNCPTSRSCERRECQRLMVLAVRSASHSSALGLKKAADNGVTPGRDSVSAGSCKINGLGPVHSFGPRRSVTACFTRQASINGARCSVAGVRGGRFEEEFIAVRGCTASITGFVARRVYRERDYLSRASRWCERRVRQRLIAWPLGRRRTACRWADSVAAAKQHGYPW